MPEDDVTLCKRCLSGDRSAWDAFVDRYKKLVCSTVRETLKTYGNPPGIDWHDIYQDVFVKLLEKLHQWQRKATLATYVRAIAFRTTIDWLRERRHITLENDKRTVDPDPVPGIFVKEFLKYLTEKERLLVKLFFIEECPPEEIAQTLNKDVGAIYVMKSRLLDKLRKLCQERGLL